ncbi:hypothetical protein GCM10027053_24490 [Intrasporangium mesophilum]
MMPYTDGEDPYAWRIAYNAWKTRVTNATNAQNAALAAYNTALNKANQLVAWRDQLARVVADMNSRVAGYATVNGTLASLATQLADLEGQLNDHLGARDTATGRLLTAPPTTQPVVLLPVRVHTAWTSSSSLAVRIFPSEVSVDRHDPRLSPMESTLAQAYWATRNRAGTGQADQAWADLTRRVTPQRAAWIVKATSPGAPAVQSRGDLDTAVTVRLLPDRFAVVLLSRGEPVNVSGTTPTYVTWGQQIAPDVPVPLLQTPGSATWLTDLQTAVTAGLAVRITIPAGAPTIDELVVIGLRGASGPNDLADLLERHIYGGGIEFLPDGATTNNGPATRTLRNADRDAAVLGALVQTPPSTTLAAASGGHQAAVLLGLTDARVAVIPGAPALRGTVSDAVSVLVRTGATGTLTRRYGIAASDVPTLNPAGAAPALRVGQQPFGILPAVDSGRWQPADTYDARFLGPMRDSSVGHLAPLDVDPAVPSGPALPPRQVTRDDDSAVPTILVEGASSMAWSSPGGTWSGVDAVVGPGTGPRSPAVYLDQLARGVRTTDVLDAARESVLGAVAVGAGSATGVAAALASLATAAATDDGRATIAAALGQHLDSLSHRVDAWVTAAAARRRTSGLTGPPVIGAYGYVTNVIPRPASRPRSFGHVLAPSLAHAATAAVLRSGYLGQRRAAWAARLADANRRGDLTAAQAARTGLANLAPLDAAAESRLPMAIDLSSRRIRRAQWILGAVRNGQPLAAVLGQQFERGLVDGGLQRYLAAFRKLTRFSTGTELASLEAARRAASDAVATARANALVAHASADATAGPLAAAQTALASATAARNAATAAWAPYQTQVDARAAALAQAQAAQNTLNALLASPPATTTHTRTVLVP